MPAWLRNALFVLFIGGILAYAVGFVCYLLARFDLVNLLGDVNIDDSFYYFQIASNLAEGKFSTFDGGISRTNGYHPIWMLLITPFYWVFDKEAALFAIKAFEIMLIAGGVVCIVVAARLARLPWVLLFAALPVLYQSRGTWMGMEASAGIFMLGLLFLALCLYARNPVRWRWVLATLAFALPWVRLEYIAISLAVTGALYVIEWSWRERSFGASWRERVRSVLAADAVIPLLGALAGILVYFAYNWLVFGGILPVSGVTKHLWSQVWWEREGGYSLPRNLLNIMEIPVFSGGALAVMLASCTFLPLLWWLVRRARRRDDWLLLVFLVGVFGVAAGHLAKFAQAVLVVHPAFAGHNWYFVPAYLTLALFIPVGCYVAVRLVLRFVTPKSCRVAVLLSRGIIGVGIVILFIRADFTYPFRYVDHANPNSWKLFSYLSAQAMNRTLPEGSVVGSWDAGVIGYFSRFPVVNLDGLVNSYEYLHGYRDAGRKTGWTYKHKHANAESSFEKFGITHFANIEPIDKKIDASIYESALIEGARTKKKKEVSFRIWSAAPLGNFNAAAWFWEKMEPHFDYRSGDAGLIVNGRTVQAFARKCPLDEEIVWSWNGSEGKAFIGPLGRWRITQTGLCVAAAVLPQNSDALMRLQPMTASDYLAELIKDRQPVIRSNYDVYLIDDSLLYVKEQCVAADTESPFFLHLIPARRFDLSVWRWPYGYDNLDFIFNDQGIVFDGKCVAVRDAPDYAIAGIRTGQYTAAGRTWGGRLVRAAEYAAVVAGEALMRSEWDLYRHQGRLYYVKEQCVAADTELPFFLHVTPADRLRRWLYGGTDNLDFDFDDQGIIFDGKCVAVRDAPDYAIASIHTGQYTATGQAWSGRHPPVVRAAEYAAVVAGEALMRSEWDLYRHEGRLYYVKEQCVAADTESPFFLHVTPADRLRRWLYGGTDNLDFDFDDQGSVFDGKCVAVHDAPDYAIAGIRTGQYTATGRAWDSRHPPVVRAAEYAAVVAGEALMRSEWDLYRHEGRLYYVKEQCQAADTESPFFLHVTPADRLRRWLYGGTDNLDFDFDDQGIIFDGRCVAVRDAPDYAIAGIRTGQYTATGQAWSGRHPPVVRAAEYAAVVAGEALIRSEWDLYRHQGRLYYVKEQCQAADTELPFFLHVTPADRLRRWLYGGTDNLDFDFDDRGSVFDGKCVAVRDAPDYAIAGIRTGQYTATGRAWDSRHPPVVRAAEYAAVVAGEALMRSEWDLYRHQGRLYYVKEQCVAADTESPFFLHLIPARRFDLSVWRWPYGYDNLDFIFNDQGIIFDGKCMAVRDAPDYAIAGIRTGQYTAAGRTWGGRLVRAAEYAAVVAGEALMRSEWDLYRHQGRLYYVKEQCQAADTESPFFLHVTPADRLRRWLYGGTDNLDFDFDDQGIIFDGKCVAVHDAPDYAIAGIHTGQYTATGQAWSGRHPPVVRAAEYAAVVAGEALMRSEWDLYRHQGRLYYVKEQCVAADTELPFFLHVTPADRLRRWLYGGTDNLDFDFDDQGIIFDGKCVAVRDAPDYAIAGIHTGQYTATGQAWSGRHPPVVRAAEYAAVVAGEALIRSEWDLYRHQGRLYYVKEQCQAADTESPFFLHVTPADRLRRWLYGGTDNLDFDFNDQGSVFDGKCVAVHDAPDYAIAGIRTGQYTATGRAWDSRHPPVVRAAEYAAVVAGEALMRSEWDLYRHQGRLYYVKEQCVAADTESPFFLHVTPADRLRRWLYGGTDNLDFDFDDRGSVFDGTCVAVRDVPDYAIAGIRTGQYTATGRAWGGRHPPVVRAAEYAAVVAGEALMRSEWDLYRHQGRLYYVKEQCVAADTESPFFLHIIPARRFDLSVWRWPYGYDNLDFIFNDQGIIFDGKCMAVRDAPDYAIAGIRTGQYMATGRTWEGSFDFAALAGDEESSQ